MEPIAASRYSHLGRGENSRSSFASGRPTAIYARGSASRVCSRTARDPRTRNVTLNRLVQKAVDFVVVDLSSADALDVVELTTGRQVYSGSGN